MPVEFEPVERTPLKLSFIKSGQVFIDILTADDFRKNEDRFQHEEDTDKILDWPGYVCSIVSLAVVDADGRKIWTEAEVAGLEKRRHAEAVKKVFAHFGRDPDEDPAKKNSPPAKS